MCPVLWLPGGVSLSCSLWVWRKAILLSAGVCPLYQVSAKVTWGHRTCSFYKFSPHSLLSLICPQKNSVWSQGHPQGELDCQTSCHRWGGLLSVNLGPLGAPSVRIQRAVASALKSGGLLHRKCLGLGPLFPSGGLIRRSQPARAAWQCGTPARLADLSEHCASVLPLLLTEGNG